MATSMKRGIIFLAFLSQFVHGAPSLHMYVKQGVRGYVRELKGNQMPSPGRPAAKGRGIPEEICIYALVNLSQVEPTPKECFYKAVHGRLIKTIRSDSTGFFETSLDTGRYSLFIRLGNLYYASLTDQYNNLAPITVEDSRLTNIDLVYRNGVTY